MTAPPVLLERDGPALWLTLNRPDSANAINGPILAALAQALTGIDEDASVRVVVVTGAGRHFCAGADLREPREERRMSRRRYGPADLSGVAVPVIAALNGDALGGGCELALTCDFRVMAADARIGVPEVRFGSLPSGGGTARLPRLIGPSRAKQLILTGEPVDAVRAEQIGLVDEVVVGDRLRERVTELTAQLCRGPDYAVRAGKSLVDAAGRGDLATDIERERSVVRAMAGREQRVTARRDAARREPTYRRIFGPPPEA